LTQPPPAPISPAKRPSMALSLFFGGILPVVAFTVIEDQYGPLWGTVAGMFFGLGEVIYEKIRHQKIAAVTWIGNLMILALGTISIISQDGVWFKLQPALFEAFFTILLWGSLFAKKSLLAMMAEKQGTKVPDNLIPMMRGMTVRLGFFFFIHTLLAVWAALEWSTHQWALLKGVGLTLSFFVYLAFEIIWIRFRIHKLNSKNLK